MDLLQSVLKFSSPVTRGIYFVRKLAGPKTTLMFEEGKGKETGLC